MSGVPMMPPLVALVLFAVWGLLLVVAIGITFSTNVLLQATPTQMGLLKELSNLDT